MAKLRFSEDWEDWRGKVQNWAKKHSVMIKRYALLQDYESLMTRMRQLPIDEWDHFFNRMIFENEYWLNAPEENLDAYIFENDGPQGS